MRVSCNETDPMMHGRPTPSRGFGCAGRAVPPPCRRRGEGERRSVATDKFLALFLAEHASESCLTATVQRSMFACSGCDCIACPSTQVAE